LLISTNFLQVIIFRIASTFHNSVTFLITSNFCTWLYLWLVGFQYTDFVKKPTFRYSDDLKYGININNFQCLHKYIEILKEYSPYY